MVKGRGWTTGFLGPWDGANILMEPDDRYLCIVPSTRKGPAQVFLPFEEDRLTLILSKAFMLADDASITDPSILGQLSRT